MQTLNIAILHPGQMGVSVAATMQNSGYRVFWASQGRSPQTLERANRFNLVDALTLTALVESCSVMVSVCPPEAAEDLARQVMATGFKGLYLDANAISPRRAKGIGEAMKKVQIDFVDGGIIGGPAWEPGKTWLYLSGERAAEAAAYFRAGPLSARVISSEVGKASALKMCFAAYSKGSRAMLCAVLGAAQNLGVLDNLRNQWGTEFYGRAVEGAVNVTQKAWRFVAEMEEIAATFRGAGMPSGFHQAAADLYRRLEHFKDADPMPSFEEVLLAILQTEP